ncbi:MAG UNVERIFIED_CONTAM: TetR/AcrR family transcriptional regulator [Anaerolineae bacterium]|jgi:AcrR family transcriptional regulator
MNQQDPRARRTRQLLFETLVQLIVERQEYDPISVKDLADRAEISRSTFYMHFRDKDELLYEVLSETYLELIRKNHTDATHVVLDNCIWDDFLHVASHADFYRVMLGEKGSAAVLHRIWQLLAKLIMDLSDDTQSLSPQVRDMLGYTLAGAQIGITKWWLENDMVFTPKQMAQHLYQLSTSSLLTFLPNLTTE